MQQKKGNMGTFPEILIIENYINQRKCNIRKQIEQPNFQNYL